MLPPFCTGLEPDADRAHEGPGQAREQGWQVQGCRAGCKESQAGTGEGGVRRLFIYNGLKGYSEAGTGEGGLRRLFMYSGLNDSTL